MTRNSATGMPTTMTNTIPKRAGDPTHHLAHLGTIPFLAGALLLAADYQLMKQAQITISYFRLRCHVTGVVVAALLVSLIFL